MLHSEVQGSAVQCKCSAVQCSAVQCSAVQCKCSAIRVGRSLLNKHSFLMGFAQNMSCEKCNFPRENPLHYITQCDYYSDSRLVMLDKIKAFIPNIHLLPKKRHYDILVHGYDKDNVDLNF